MTEKFKLVPVEPDDTMVEATFAGMLETRDVPGQMKRRAEMRRRIALAIAAAPEAPAAEPVAWKEAEQIAFEKWIASAQPNGDADQVQSAWLCSPDRSDAIEDFVDGAALEGKQEGETK